MELKIYNYIKDGVSLTFLAVMQCSFKIFCCVAVFKDPMTPQKRQRVKGGKEYSSQIPFAFALALFTFAPSH